MTADGEIIATSTVTATMLDAHIMVQSIIYNRLAMSGGVEGWNPATGRPARIKFVYGIADQSFVLADGELCTCELECNGGRDDV